jgi:hypothetical protein
MNVLSRPCNVTFLPILWMYLAGPATLPSYISYECTKKTLQRHLLTPAACTAHILINSKRCSICSKYLPKFRILQHVQFIWLIFRPCNIVSGKFQTWQSVLRRLMVFSSAESVLLSTSWTTRISRPCTHLLMQYVSHRIKDTYIKKPPLHYCMFINVKTVYICSRCS